MKILFYSASYIPSRRASSINAVNMSSAFARFGHDVTLVSKLCLERQESVENDYDFYGVDPNFAILKLDRPLVRGGGLVYLAKVLQQLLESRKKIDLIFSRDIEAAYFATLLKYRVVFDAHTLSQNRYSQFLCRRLFSSPHFERLVVTTQALKNDFLKLGLIQSEGKIVVATNGARPPIPDYLDNKLVESNKGINEHIKKIGYVGHLYEGRGVEVIYELALRLTNFEFHVVGGTDHDIKMWQERSTPPNLYFHGFITPANLANYYLMFDILLMPYQNYVKMATGDDSNARWMCPMKMLEYMSTGKPIVSSNLPVLQEVLTDGQNSLLVEPDNVDAWERAIERLTNDEALAVRLGRTAGEEFENNYTWEARARKALQGL